MGKFSCFLLPTLKIKISYVLLIANWYIYVDCFSSCIRTIVHRGCFVGISLCSLSLRRYMIHGCGDVTHVYVRASLVECIGLRGSHTVDAGVCETGRRQRAQQSRTPAAFRPLALLPTCLPACLPAWLPDGAQRKAIFLSGTVVVRLKLITHLREITRVRL